MTTEKKYKSAHLVDHEALSLFTAVVMPDINSENLPAARNYQFDNSSLDSTGVTETSLTLPPRDGAPPVKITIFSPTGNTVLVPGFLKIHGGGFVMGSIEMDRKFAVDVVKDCGVVVVSVHYRLAPESNKTDLVEDCYTAFLWMHEHGSEFHINKDRLAFGGSSAGGGLAAALALLVRDRNVIHPIFQHLIYPMLDDRTCNRLPGNTGEFFWTPKSNVFGWTCLLGDIRIGDPETSYYIVPGRATDLSGLPPTYLITGALDLFLEENIEHARKLYAAGVPTEFHVYPGLVHGGDIYGGHTELGKRVNKESLDAIRRHIGVKKEVQI